MSSDAIHEHLAGSSVSFGQGCVVDVVTSFSAHSRAESCVGSTNDRDTDVVLLTRQEAPAGTELLNKFLLAVVFTAYFGFRSGGLVVLPLLSEDLLGGFFDVKYTPVYQIPLCVWFIMDVVIAAPNAWFMRTYGRRRGFMLGNVCAIFASTGAFFVLMFLSSWPWLAFALLNVIVMFMSVIGMAEFVRFAAAECCKDRTHSPAAVSQVLTGGALFSMVGPLSATLGEFLSPGHTPRDHLEGYAYFFLFMSVIACVGFISAYMLRLPVPNEVVRAEMTPLRQIFRRPAVVRAVSAQVSVQFAMVLPMSAVPLTMVSLLGLPQASLIISGVVVVHIACMFLPGLVSGKLIGKLGVFPVMLSGLFLQAAALLTGLFVDGVHSFYIGLGLLGVGWNLAFVAGTVLLLDSHSLNDRPRVTSANEAMRFLANSCAVLISSSVSWADVNYISLVFVIICSATLTTSLCWPGAES